MREQAVIIRAFEVFKELQHGTLNPAFSSQDNLKDVSENEKYWWQDATVMNSPLDYNLLSMHDMESYAVVCASDNSY